MEAEIKRKEDIEKFMEKVTDLNEKLPDIIEGLNLKISEISSWYDQQMQNVNGDFSRLRRGLEEEHMNFVESLQSQFAEKKMYIENYVSNLAQHQDDVKKFSADISKNFVNIIKNMEFEPFYDILSSYYSQIHKIQESIDFLREDVIKLVKIKSDHSSLENYRKNYRNLYRDKHIFLSLCDLKKYTEEKAGGKKAQGGIGTQSCVGTEKRNKYSFQNNQNAEFKILNQEQTEQNNLDKEQFAQIEVGEFQELDDSPIAGFMHEKMPEVKMTPVMSLANGGGLRLNQTAGNQLKAKRPSSGKEALGLNTGDQDHSGNSSLASSAVYNNPGMNKMTKNFSNAQGVESKINRSNAGASTNSKMSPLSLSSYSSSNNSSRIPKISGLNNTSHTTGTSSGNTYGLIPGGMDLSRQSRGSKSKSKDVFDDDLKMEAQKLIETVGIFVGLKKTHRSETKTQGNTREKSYLTESDAEQEKIVMVSVKENLDETEDRQISLNTVHTGERFGTVQGIGGIEINDTEAFERLSKAESDLSDRQCQPTEIYEPKPLNPAMQQALKRVNSKDIKGNPFAAANDALTLAPYSPLGLKPFQTNQKNTVSGSSAGARAGLISQGYRNVTESKSIEKKKRGESPIVMKRVPTKKAEENESFNKQVSSGIPASNPLRTSGPYQGNSNFLSGNALSSNMNSRSSVYNSIINNAKIGSSQVNRLIKPGANQTPAGPTLSVSPECRIPSQAPAPGSNHKPMFFPTKQGVPGVSIGGNPSNMELYKKLQLKQMQSSNAKSGGPYPPDSHK